MAKLSLRAQRAGPHSAVSLAQEGLTEQTIFMRITKRMATFMATAVACGCVASVLLLNRSNSENTEANPTQLVPVSAQEKEAPELALLMDELQRLTHKMALSADAENADLAEFYLYESLEQLQKIQTEVPEYEGQPVALLIDRMGLPAYAALKAATSEKPANREQLLKGLDAVVNTCNACHIATLHGFIRITRGTEVNPFNQSFKP